MSPYIISRYAYALFQVKNFSKCNEIIRESLEKKTIEIKEEKLEPCDALWSEADKTDRIAELQLELTGLRQLMFKLKSGYRPPLEVDLHTASNCYLFGCTQHGHSEYVCT